MRDSWFSAATLPELAVRTAAGRALRLSVDVRIFFPKIKIPVTAHWSLRSYNIRSYWLPITASHFQRRLQTGRQPHQARLHRSVHLFRRIRPSKYWISWSFSCFFRSDKLRNSFCRLLTGILADKPLQTAIVSSEEAAALLAVII